MVTLLLIPVSRFQCNNKLSKTDSLQDTCLGTGGFGTVYRGCWNRNDVAVKVIKRKGGHKELMKFVSEYQVLE
jgi:hypothetical protein